MIAMLSPCSSFAVLSDMLSYRISDSLLLRGQNTSCVSQQQEAGVTPEARRDRAPILRRGWVAPASGRVLAAFPSPFLLPRLRLFLPSLISPPRCRWR